MRVPSLAAAALVALVSSSSYAADPPADGASNDPLADPLNPALKPPRKTEPQAPRTDLAPDDKRTPPDYDGRPDETSVGEDMLWIPRVIFFPVYVVTDFVIRRPLGFIVMAVERNDVVGEVIDIFTFGPHDNAGLVPTAFVDFGLRPSFGIYHFYDDFLAPHNNLRATFATGGEKWLKASVTDRIPLALRRDEAGEEEVATSLSVSLSGLVRPDLLFYGTGPSSRERDEARYEMRTMGGAVGIQHAFTKVNTLHAWAGARRYTFNDGECDRTLVPSADTGQLLSRCATRTVSERVADGEFAMPNGFTEPSTIVNTGIRVALDSRDPWPAAGSGVAVEAKGEFGIRPGNALTAWIAYGGALAGFLDLTGTRRILSLTVDVRLVDAIDPDAGVPFTELIGAKRLDDVPDLDLMRGFRPGRLTGESSTVATVEYSWPIWSFLDGTLQAAVGNVWGRRFESFDPEKLRFSFAGGIRTPNRRDHTFNFLVGFGTAPFEDGAAVEGPRVVLGTTTGF